MTPVAMPAAVVVFALSLIALGGCESTGGGSVSGGAYYGVGLHDPWYYGAYHDDPDIVVTPPAGRPDGPSGGARPSQPIANPPSGSPSPTPMPSIPSASRATPRGGGGRR